MELRHCIAAISMVATVFAIPSSSRAQPPAVSPVEWPTYGGDTGGSRYSPAADITSSNVGRLEVAWVYRTGDYAVRRGRFEATPIFVEGTLYLSTPFGRVVALDPERGAERWQYDPRIDFGGDYGDFANRGVSTWLDPTRSRDAVCRRRIFVATVDARLIALDAASGRPCADFGVAGTVDLEADMANPAEWKGEYQVTSPPAVLNGKVIVGSAIADNQRTDAPSGVVRAFDAVSGKLMWSWDPIPKSPESPAWETWGDGSALRTGAANAWSVLSVDGERDLVFVPTGSASPDFYGGERPGANLYANSVVALRGATGEVVWHFQAVHHDLWDYDVPAQPVLATIRSQDQETPVVIQATKMGHVFILHRDTGEPIFPVEERPVPISTVPGEEAWPTQPFPTLPRPLVPSSLTAAEAWGATPEDRAYCRERIAGARSDGIFTPPSLEGTVIFPGNVGGSNWGSVAVDVERGILVAPTNRLAFLVRLVRNETASEAEGAEFAAQRGTPYGMVREVLMAPSGVPCNAPPWGVLTAMDLGTGEVLWEAPHGHLPALAGQAGSASWGSPGLGGAIVTAGGLAIAAGTLDEHLHAYSVETGERMWEAKLPAGGNATPITYRTEGGRQFIVVAAGGHDRLGTTMGDYVVAFALPAEAGAAPAAAGEPSAASVSIEGAWRGDLFAGDRRLGVELRLTAERDRDGVRGRISGTDSSLSGALAGRRRGERVFLEGDFSYAEEACDGRLAMELEIANGGGLLVGEVTVSGACAEEGPEPATIAVRR